ncbi:hypothetical protein AB5J72_03775 [Streptomyces sp. CG1]|uniref:hypothetical protein n=1 Tax=Streptomyces sp. CG1 TaxID=1287523 RepID=UPI0034E2AD16
MDGPLTELGAPVRQLRWDAAIRLVRMATGRSRASCARYLGITPGALHSTAVRIRAWQKEAGDAAAYQAALHRVADIAIRDRLSQRTPMPRRAEVVVDWPGRRKQKSPSVAAVTVVVKAVTKATIGHAPSRVGGRRRTGG